MYCLLYIKIYRENSENIDRESKAESRKPCGWWLATEIKIEFLSNGAGNGWGSLIGPDPARVLTQHTNTQKRVRFLWGFIYISIGVFMAVF